MISNQLLNFMSKFNYKGIFFANSMNIFLLLNLFQQLYYHQ